MIKVKRYVTFKLHGDEVTADCTCRYCGEHNEVKMTFDQFLLLQQGVHIQKVMPEVPASTRELLISGTCGKCWDDLFKEEDMDAKCKDCGKEYTVAHREAMWFIERGFEIPKRCPECRKKRKERNYG